MNKKLNLGCGRRSISGYVNIDIQPYDNVDLVSDITCLPYEKNSIDEIYSCAAIEHFGRNEWKNVATHWYDILKPSGVLRISTADFAACCEEYIENGKISNLFGLIVGGQKDYTDQHGMIFDFDFLKIELQKIGFSDVKRYDWRQFDAFKQDPDYDDYSRSYIPHMDFENGRLMMLNVVCKK
jgi:predicted SAM-dependent methyltransferase